MLPDLGTRKPVKKHTAKLCDSQMILDYVVQIILLLKSEATLIKSPQQDNPNMSRARMIAMDMLNCIEKSP